MLRNPVHLLAFGFGSGLSPKAPGTMGTLVAIPVFLLMAGLSIEAYLGIVAVVALVGCYICGKTAKDLGVHDYGGIVRDEIAGFLLVMTALPATLPWILAGFCLFRLFDIWKPWPVSLCDKKVEGGLGIMLDDLVAAVMAWIPLYLVHQLVS